MDAGTLPKGKCTARYPTSDNPDVGHPMCVPSAASFSLDGGENNDFSGFNYDF